MFALESSPDLEHFLIRLSDLSDISSTRTRSMDLSHMTIAEIEASLRLLAEWERRELMLLMLERRETERQGWLH